MAFSANDLIAAPDKRVDKGLDRVVLGMLSERHADIELDHFGLWEYDEDTEAAKALEARLAVHTKAQNLWDDGEGRDGLHVVCLDGKPIAVVREHGHEHYNYEVAALDMAAIDGLVRDVLALRDRVKKMDQTAHDVDITGLLRLSRDPEPEAGPACG